MTLCWGLHASAFLRRWGRRRIYPSCLVFMMLPMVATLVHILRLVWRLTFRVTLCPRLHALALLHRRHGTLGPAALSNHVGRMPKYVSLSAALDARSTSWSRLGPQSATWVWPCMTRRAYPLVSRPFAMLLPCSTFCAPSLRTELATVVFSTWAAPAS